MHQVGRERETWRSAEDWCVVAMDTLRSSSRTRRGTGVRLSASVDSDGGPSSKSLTLLCTYGAVVVTVLRLVMAHDRLQLTVETSLHHYDKQKKKRVRFNPYLGNNSCSNVSPQSESGFIRGCIQKLGL